MRRGKDGRYRQPTLIEEALEIMGDALIVAFGAVALFIFIVIEVFGRFGHQPNRYILWIEIFMGVPMIVLGTERFVKDARRFTRLRRRRT